MNPRADTLDLLPFQGSPFNHLGTSPRGLFPHNRLDQTQRLGFEPREVLPSPVFKTGALNQLDHLCIFIFRRNRLLRYYTNIFLLSTAFLLNFLSFSFHLLPSLVLISYSIAFVIGQHFFYVYLYFFYYSLFL